MSSGDVFTSLLGSSVTSFNFIFVTRKMGIEFHYTQHFVLGDDLTFGTLSCVVFDIDLFIKLSKDFGCIHYSYTRNEYGVINEFARVGVDRAFFLGSL